MSTLSEEEKRRLLRERRAAKLNKGGSSRLEKITGSTNSFLPTDTPTSKPKPTSQSPAVNSSTTRIQDEAARKKSNRISQTFSTPVDSLHGDDDPDVGDISEYIKTSNNAPPSSNESMPDMDQLLKSLFSGTGHQHLDGADGSSDGLNDPLGGVPGMDKLMQTMSMFSNFSDPSGEKSPEDEQKNQQTLEELDYQSKLDLYNKQEAKKFKFLYTSFRFFIIALIYYTSFFDLTFLPLMSTWDKFLLADLGFMSYFFIHISTSPNYKSESWIYTGLNFISGLLGPNVGFTKYLRILAKYSELFALFISDFCFLIFLFALSAIF